MPKPKADAIGELQNAISIKRKRRAATEGEQHQQGKKSKADKRKLAEPAVRGAGKSASDVHGRTMAGGSGGLGLVADYGTSSSEDGDE